MTVFSAAPVPESCVKLWQIHCEARQLAGKAITPATRRVGDQTALFTFNNWWNVCEREVERRMAVLERLANKDKS